MKNPAKLCVLGIFALFSFVWFVNGLASSPGQRVRAQAQPTPPANANTANAVSNANMPANTNTAVNANAAPVNANMAVNANANSASGNTSIPTNFTLGTNSQSDKYGEVAFNHENHASKNYNVGGTATIGCVECHHTDQPKSALKPPLQKSEREETLTIESWKASAQKKVNTCGSCHFQEGLVPDGKEMPEVDGLVLNNENAYHKNCNDCHDAAAKLRADLKKKPGFAIGTDCLSCHKKP